MIAATKMSCEVGTRTKSDIRSCARITLKATLAVPMKNLESKKYVLRTLTTKSKAPHPASRATASAKVLAKPCTLQLNRTLDDELVPTVFLQFVDQLDALVVLGESQGEL